MNPEFGRNLATSSGPLASETLAQLLAAHAEFLAAGGGGGSWELLSVAGLPLCIYRGGAEAGTQLVLRHKQLAAGTSLRDRNLASSDLSGSACDGADFRGAKLDGSAAIDGFFAGADFSRASLRGVDFSGSDLRGCNFSDADLTEADFEHTDCTEADFTGANVERARFPGAILEGIVRRSSPRRSFRERLETMVAQLRAHPEVEIYEFTVGPPASEAQLAAAEAALGLALPPALRAFYAAHDGVFLQWGLRGQDYPGKSAAFEYPDYGTPPGAINLLPVAAAWSKHWELDSFVNTIADDQLIRLFGAVPDPRPPVAAVVIDNYAKYYHGDLVLGGAHDIVVVASDHGADMDSSDWVGFETYLDLIVAQYGTCRYQRALGIGWTRASRQLPSWAPHPSLDEVIAGIERE